MNIKIRSWFVGFETRIDVRDSNFEFRNELRYQQPNFEDFS